MQSSPHRKFEKCTAHVLTHPDKTNKRHLFGINDINGTKLLTRLRVDFSDLRLHKFDHRLNCDSPTYTCSKSPTYVQSGHKPGKYGKPGKLREI